MTDNEIIKALELHAPALQHGEEQSLYAQALDLIKRQQARIELLTRENDEVFDSYTQSVWHRDEQIKAAIKEFAEKLLDRLTIVVHEDDEFLYDCYDVNDTHIEINNLIQEMVDE